MFGISASSTRISETMHRPLKLSSLVSTACYSGACLPIPTC
jgi:hypothetical protein